MRVSIITASYNYAQYIEVAIDSVINQSYQDWELIIVDDGSSDNSVEIIKSYCGKDNRIKLFQHEGGVNKGLKETIMLGLKNATGDWVAFLESDDFFMPDNLAKKVDIIEKNPSIKLIFNKVDFLNESDKKHKKQKKFDKTQSYLSKTNFPKNMFKDFYQNNMILTFSAVMVDKNSLLDTDFNTPIDAHLDWWLWIHLAYNNDFCYIDEALTKWRLHENSYIKNRKKQNLTFTPIEAYDDVYKKNGKPLFFLPFLIYSKIKFLLTRGFAYLIKRCF